MSDFITHTIRMVISVGFITSNISSFSQIGVQAMCEFTQRLTVVTWQAEYHRKQKSLGLSKQ